MRHPPLGYVAPVSRRKFPHIRIGAKSRGDAGAATHPSYNPFEGSSITRSPTSAKQMAALGSIGSALILVGLKVFLAAATGSLGILSEALHSGLDLIAAILT